MEDVKVINLVRERFVSVAQQHQQILQEGHYYLRKGQVVKESYRCKP